MRWRLWGPIAALVASVALAACGAGAHKRSRLTAKYGSEIVGTLPATGRPARGGTITVGQLAGQTPSDIFPLVDDRACSTPTLNFIQNQYIPLYAGPDGAEPKIDEGLSAAEPPRYSDADRTVTITIKPGLRWSDGQPVDAQDVIFYLDLLKAALKSSPEDWCQYSAAGIPGDVASWTTRGADTVILRLVRAVNPTWFTANQLHSTAGGIYPLPSQAWNIDAAGGEHVTDWATSPADALRIYAYLHGQGEDLATFASNPLWKVVDGPFALKDFDAASGAYDLVPNASYRLNPKAYASDISVRTYASSASVLQALESGALEIGTLDSGAKPASIPKLRRAGYSVFGGPGWGWFGGLINFRDTTDHFDKVVAQPYMRGVFAELVNQAEIVKDVYHGWAVAAYGPVPTAPSSPYVSAAATRAAWPYNPTQAVATLRARGWDVRPGGQTTCAKPGTAADECGSGIPAGTPIKFVWANPPSSTSSAGAQESQIFAREARRAAGIDVSFVSKSFSFLTVNYNDENPAAAKYVNDWGVNDYGGVYTDYYPTADGLMGPGEPLNMGAYDDPAAQRRMAASVASPRARAIVSEVSYFSKSYPVFYMPDPDLVAVVSAKVGGARSAFLAMTQQQYAYQFLYRSRRH